MWAVLEDKAWAKSITTWTDWRDPSWKKLQKSQQRRCGPR
jgi:hypothetical protein